MKFRDKMIEAMKEHARGHIAKHKMNVEVYFRNAAGIGGDGNADILEEIEKELNSIGANYEKLNYEDLISKTSEFLSNEKAIGWFQGRMEFGPRALGCRSILGDPRSDKMQKNLN